MDKQVRNPAPCREGAAPGLVLRDEQAPPKAGSWKGLLWAGVRPSNAQRPWGLGPWLWEVWGPHLKAGCQGKDDKAH